MLRPRPGVDLFLASVLVLFLELACIRWFPAHVIFLSFFTNTMLLASFVGMSVGCLLARRPTRHIAYTPVVLLVALLAGLMVERYHDLFQQVTAVGDQARPDVVFFGAEGAATGDLTFKVPVELMLGVFFVLAAAALVGPGQELGRAFNRMADRTQSYTLNLLGSLAGIGVFALFSYLWLPPVVWFAAAGGLVVYFLRRPEPDGSRPRPLLPAVALLLGVLVTVPTSFSGVPGFTERSQVRWSPYYRIDLSQDTNTITTNQTGHQRMIALQEPAPTAYDMPYAFQRALGRPDPLRILIIGAGSGNDVSRALYWCGKETRIDAVDIDPVIQGYGEQHPNKPYSDPRVTKHLNDGRNFLRQAADGTYDLVVFALVDSLVLHSGYSSIRLESFLFTEESMRDVRRVLKPSGTLAVYNYFRQGFIMMRLHALLKDVFGADPVVLTDPPADKDTIKDELYGSHGMFFAAEKSVIDPLHAAFGKGAFWLPRWANMQKGTEGKFASDADKPTAEYPVAPELVHWAGGNTSTDWVPLRAAAVSAPPEELRRADDNWPFLYVRRPAIPDLTWTGAGVMLGLSVLLWAALHFLTRREPATAAAPAATDPAEWGLLLRAFFMGGGFMLIETKAVVQMALLFGSTWVVNTVVFAAILVMAVVGNLFAGRVKPTRLEPYYVGLFVAIGVGLLVPLGWLLGLPPVVQVVAACLLAFTPVAFAGVIFPTTFARTKRPDWFFAANVAGALVGGLVENASMLLGFQYLLLVAAGFYALSAAFGNKSPVPNPESRPA